MTAADYIDAAPGGITLLGTPVTTPWNPELAEAMREKGRAVMEERLLEQLLDDLISPDVV
jgi:hypothetical protein